MTRYAIAGSGHRHDALQLKPFTTSGALSGVTSPWTSGHLRGHALRAFYDDRNAIDYAILSYSTPIAWHTPAGWTVVADSFSMTTSHHQSAIYYVPRDRVVGFNWSGLTDAQRALLFAIRDSATGEVIVDGQRKRTAAVLVERGLILHNGFNPGGHTLTDDTRERISA